MTAINLVVVAEAWTVGVAARAPLLMHMSRMPRTAPSGSLRSRTSPEANSASCHRAPNTDFASADESSAGTAVVELDGMSRATNGHPAEVAGVNRAWGLRTLNPSREVRKSCALWETDWISLSASAPSKIQLSSGGHGRGNSVSVPRK